MSFCQEPERLRWVSVIHCFGLWDLWELDCEMSHDHWKQWAPESLHLFLREFSISLFKKKTSLELTRPGFIKNGDVLIREIIQPFGIFQFSTEQSLWESTMSWQNMFNPQLRSYHLNVVQPRKNHPPLSTPDPFSHQFKIGLDRKVIHAPRVGFLGWKKSFLWNQIKI